MPEEMDNNSLTARCPGLKPDRPAHAGVLFRYAMSMSTSTASDTDSISAARRFTRCPKCQHSPLPADQSLPAACTSCGLIFAKYGAEVVRPEPESMDDDDAEPSFLRLQFEQLHEAARYIPERVDPALLWARAALLLLAILWGLRLIWLDHRTGEMNSSFLHGPLLVFHEAGHVIFRLLGEFMMVLGGTLGQLLMPAIMTVALLKNRDPFGAAIGLWLFGVSLLDVAPYVYDALHPQLILLGGHTGEQGGHDWMYLLGETGLIKRAQGLGWLVHKLGALVMMSAVGWAAWVLKQQRQRLEQPMDAGEM